MQMNHGITWIGAAVRLAIGILASGNGETPAPDRKQNLERTSIQIGRPFDARIDIRSNVAKVYGINGDLEWVEVEF